MKTIKIAVIAMMGLSLGINAQQWNSNGSNTTTGNITINSGTIGSHFKRKFDYNVGGWARTLIEYENSLMSSGNFRIGSYGGTTNYTYSYIGYGTYSDVKNLKLYPNGNTAFGGSVKIGNFTTGLNMNTAGNDFLIQGVNINFATWNSIHLRADGSDGLYLQKDTNRVGIGTTSPNAKLDIKGDLKLGNGSTYTDLIFKTGTTISGTNGVFEILPKTMPGSGTARQTTYFKNASHSNGKTEHNVVVDGNVGIGTTNPGSWRLAVNGQIRAKEIKVETGWSDFVFYDNYNLPTLKEVEKYIKEKGHLKDIPSAKEVEKHGIFLGEMDAKLLQKIEELTLYTIEQEKKIKSQENKISALEKSSSKIEKQQKEIEKLKTLVKKILKDKS